MVFAAPSVRVLRDEVTLAVEQAILAGGIRPGERLIEGEIARQMGISKAPVREALRHLEQLGLVVSHPRRGTFVAELTPIRASEAFSLRALLESYAVRLAAPKFDDSRLPDLLAPLEVADLPETSHGRAVDCDLEFHDRLFELGGHGMLTQAWTNLRAQIRVLLTATGVLRAFSPDRAANLAAEMTFRQVHEPIVVALRAHDPDRAEAEIVYHVAEGERRLLEKLATFPVEPQARLADFARRPDLATRLHGSSGPTI